MIAVVGEVELQRAYYPCQSCPQGQFPLDTEFDIEATQYSPGVHRMMALAGSETSFQQGREQLEVLAGLEVTASMRPANLPLQRRILAAAISPQCPRRQSNHSLPPSVATHPGFLPRVFRVNKQFR